MSIQCVIAISFISILYYSELTNGKGTLRTERGGIAGCIVAAVGIEAIVAVVAPCGVAAVAEGVPPLRTFV